VEVVGRFGKPADVTIIQPFTAVPLSTLGPTVYSNRSGLPASAAAEGKAMNQPYAGD
jgi:hypothetical protein